MCRWNETQFLFAILEESLFLKWVTSIDSSSCCKFITINRCQRCQLWIFTYPTISNQLSWNSSFCRSTLLCRFDEFSWQIYCPAFLVIILCSITHFFSLKVASSNLFTDFVICYSDVVDGEEFLTLTYQDVIRLISCDKLTVSSEEKVCYLFWTMNIFLHF